MKGVSFFHFAIRHFEARMNACLNPQFYMEFSGLIFDCENGLTRVKIVPRCV
tara:strand:+ start:15 stop:170 length:156 start_codon:yes stop_codon:yes gene_type:complete